MDKKLRKQNQSLSVPEDLGNQISNKKRRHHKKLNLLMLSHQYIHRLRVEVTRYTSSISLPREYFDKLLWPLSEATFPRSWMP